MADSKITALASIGTGTDPANDPLVIVDVSDVSPGGMSATGTTKKVTLNNLLACSPTATLASATITGDLTVDTSTLKVDSANNRVGIGTATPGVRFDILSDNNTSLAAVLRVNSNNAAVNTSLAYDGLVGSGAMTLQCGVAPFIVNTNGANERYRIASDGVATWSNVGGVAGTAMTLNSTGLGVGASPQVKLTVRTPHAVATATTYTGGLLIHDEANGIAPHLGAGIAYNGGDQISWIQSNSSSGVYPLALNPAGGEVRIGGNLLVGTTNSVIWNTTNQGCVVGGNAVQASRSNDVALLLNRIGSDGKTAVFARQGLEVGDISVTTTGTTYNSTSDYRLKEAVQPLSGGLSRVNALKPSVYKWKSNGFNGEGFLAHELAEVVPAAVSGEKDAVNEDGSIKAQSVDMSRVVPILVAAIQELAAEVNALKNA